MLYAIHIYERAGGRHCGYLRCNMRVQPATGDFPEPPFLTRYQKSAYDIAHKLRNENIEGKILVEPFPETSEEEEIANRYLQWCHRSRINFI